MKATKNLLINKTASLFSQKNYIRLLLLMSFILRVLGYDSIKKLEQVPIPLDSGETFDVTKITLYSGKQLMLTSPIRANRILKGIDHAGERLLYRYEVSNREKLTLCTVFVDVGANVGELSHLMSKRVAVVLAIEPDPIARHCLEFNLKGVANVVVMPCALGELDEIAKFFLLPGSADSTLFNSQSLGTPYVDLEVRRGDDVLLDYFTSEDVVVIKMDAEGFEPEVLRGMQQLLLQTDLICIDTGRERGGESTTEDCVQLLVQAGFRVTVTKHLITIGERDV